MAHDGFISYSVKDRTGADAVCATLESRKIRCLIAPRDVPPGHVWASVLVNPIDVRLIFACKPDFYLWKGHYKLRLM